MCLFLRWLAFCHYLISKLYTHFMRRRAGNLKMQWEISPKVGKGRCPGSGEIIYPKSLEIAATHYILKHSE